MNYWDTIKNTPMGRALSSAPDHPEYKSIRPDDLADFRNVLFPEPGLVELSDPSDVSALQVAQVAVVAQKAYGLWLDLIYVFRDCESPIERLFLSALITLESNYACSMIIHGKSSTLDLLSGMEMDLHIYPQHVIGDFRTDFLLEFEHTTYISNKRPTGVTDDPVKRKCSLIVECDGHDFHERTKEQASRDKERDRVLQSCGYRVFRFTGSDIHRDSIKCAKECVDYLHREVIKDT
jgi:hypothetical protein